MISKPVNDLKPGDKFCIGEDAHRQYTVTSKTFASDNADICILGLRERPDLVLPYLVEVSVTQMYRLVQVPCLVHKENVALLYDLASGGTPRAVLCGDCDKKSTDEVMARMNDE